MPRPVQGHDLTGADRCDNGTPSLGAINKDEQPVRNPTKSYGSQASLWHSTTEKISAPGRRSWKKSTKDEYDFFPSQASSDSDSWQTQQEFPYEKPPRHRDLVSKKTCASSERKQEHGQQMTISNASRKFFSNASEQKRKSYLINKRQRFPSVRKSVVENKRVETSLTSVKLRTVIGTSSFNTSSKLRKVTIKNNNKEIILSNTSRSNNAVENKKAETSLSSIKSRTVVGSLPLTMPSRLRKVTMENSNEEITLPNTSRSNKAVENKKAETTLSSTISRTVIGSLSSNMPSKFRKVTMENNNKEITLSNTSKSNSAVENKKVETPLSSIKSRTAIGITPLNTASKLRKFTMENNNEEIILLSTSTLRSNTSLPLNSKQKALHTFELADENDNAHPFAESENKPEDFDDMFDRMSHTSSISTVLQEPFSPVLMSRANSSSFRGFPNPAGTNKCWMNSTLQVIIGMRRFVEEVKSYKTEEEKNGKYSKLLKNFIDVVNIIQSGLQLNIKLQIFYVSLGILNADFPKHKQQDAVEFLTLFISALREEFDQDAADEYSWIKNPVTNNIVFKLAEVHTCVKCMKYDVQETEHLTMVLNIPSTYSGQPSLQDALEKTMMVEVRALECEQCDSRHCKVTTMLSHLPRFFILELSRFIMENGVIKKKCDSMKIPPTLKVTSIDATNLKKLFQSEDSDGDASLTNDEISKVQSRLHDGVNDHNVINNTTDYRLSAIISHEGVSLNSGAFSFITPVNTTSYTLRYILLYPPQLLLLFSNARHLTIKSFDLLHSIFFKDIVMIFGQQTG
ncbi:hypothetical protein ANN_24732 [Periplaneta americana]|uniref:USP domain-containing protein n=1 Tax=Periplaneta americana TaxID=6978 RepID=A0ABQ8S035_PERAM|nr:hypothetical protein ANN_24732 [Periplaneta americana]